MKSVITLLVIVALVAAGALSLVPDKKPLVDNAPVSQTDPTNPGTPTNPKPPEPAKLKLISFSESGKAEAKPFNELAVDILCQVPDKTQIVFDKNIIVRDPKWSAPDKPQKENSLFIETGAWEIILLGVNPTAELTDKLGYTHVAETGVEYVEVPAGTVIGTVGHPLKNDWGEGINLVILIGVYPENKDDLQLAVASILESLR
ncbi:MAG: hypothetical protein M1471_03040 [Patescibacteria group bacterium]|nr:hypothetical protein [Patescibacteria group bacterium]